MATQFNRPPLRTITDFKSKMAGGGARPNLFEVELVFPDPIAIENDVKEKSRFLVKLLNYLHLISHLLKLTSEVGY